VAVRIRLSRAGAKKRPYYRIVVADVRSPRDGRFIERIGSFNPLLRKDDPKRLTLDLERAKHWLSNGAVATDRVATFLADANLIPRPKQANSVQKSKPKAKAQERLKAAEAAAEAAKAAAEAPASA
jgi:small subunit ribosomal protein S16